MISINHFTLIFAGGAWLFLTLPGRRPALLLPIMVPLIASGARWAELKDIWFIIGALFAMAALFWMASLC